MCAANFLPCLCLDAKSYIFDYKVIYLLEPKLDVKLHPDEVFFGHVFILAYC